MSGDEDIARLLPDPPPPRPARRDATIALALQRFDGNPASPPEDAPDRSPARPRPAWGRIGALASIALVVMISVPIALRTPGGELARPEPHGAPSPAESAGASRSPVSGGTQPVANARDGSERVADAGAAKGGTAPAAATIAGEIRAAPATRAAPGGVRPDREVAAAPPPPPPPPPPAEEPARDFAVVAARRAPAPASQAPSAVTAMDIGSFAESRSADDNIVVTGTRARTAPARGGWNACTVDDPERSLRGCQALVDSGAKGASGAAAVHLSEGLQRAWRRDWDGAVAAFDQAIALQPRLAFAWLNRGLVRRHTGELERAEADLDRAIRYAPRAPRGYHHRSLVREERGNARGARADAARARRLDPGYDAVTD